MTNGSTCTQRAMTPEERAHLENWYRILPGLRRTQMRVGALLWGVQMLVFALGWFALVWLVRGALGVGIDWDPHVVFGIGAIVCAVWAWSATQRNLRSWRERVMKLGLDLAGGVVDDISLVLTAAKPFHDPAHGDVVFFLRTDDERVYVLAEEQETDNYGDGASDAPTPQPKTRLRIVRAPQTGYIVRQTFSGEPLPLDPPADLLAKPDDWPEFDAFCSVPWDALDARFGART